MAARYLRLRLALGVALACVLQLPSMCLAQQSPRDPNDLPHTANQEAADCPPLAAFPLMHRAVVESCNRGDSVEVTLPLKPDAKGFAQEKRIRGVYEFREYRMFQAEQDYIFDNLMNQLPMAGFKIKCSMKPFTITARNGDTWILINVAGDSYNVSVVREPQETWTPVKTAEGISREMQAQNRVDIYGIEFLPADQSISEEQSPIIFEMLKYLKQNPSLSVIIESHKVSTGGTPADDLEITRERANAIMDWLILHGIARARVQPRPFGRNNPLTENESPSEIRRNERIALVRTGL
jgi:outer membrane protein OmpA-like peptidoglycan-associated protein